MELFEDQPYIHCEVSNWSPSLFKKYLIVFEVVKNRLREEGYSKMYSGLMEEDVKTIKFNQMFGFEIERNGGGIVVLSQVL